MNRGKYSRNKSRKEVERGDQSLTGTVLLEHGSGGFRGWSHCGGHSKGQSFDKQPEDF